MVLAATFLVFLLRLRLTPVSTPAYYPGVESSYQTGRIQALISRLLTRSSLRILPSGDLRGIFPPIGHPSQIHRLMPFSTNVGSCCCLFPGSIADSMASVFRSGINLLHSTSVDDSALGPRLLTLSHQSQALRAVCIAFQASLTPEMLQQFYEYFDVAIATFRTELSHSGNILTDGTWNAGLILCTIGVCGRFPFQIAWLHT